MWVMLHGVKTGVFVVISLELSRMFNIVLFFLMPEMNCAVGFCVIWICVAHL